MQLLDIRRDRLLDQRLGRGILGIGIGIGMAHPKVPPAFAGSYELEQRVVARTAELAVSNKELEVGIFCGRDRDGNTAAAGRLCCCLHLAGYSQGRTACLLA